MNKIESLLFHFSVEMILYKFIKVLTKIQEFGEANSLKERNKNTKLKEDT
jgi:hypothetical protein